MSYSTCPACPAKCPGVLIGGALLTRNSHLFAFKVLRSQTYPSSSRNLLVCESSKRYELRRNKRLDTSQKLPYKEKTCQQEIKIKKNTCARLRILEEGSVNIREQRSGCFFTNQMLSLSHSAGNGSRLKPNFFVLFFRCFQSPQGMVFGSFHPSKFPVVKKKQMIQRAFPIILLWITTDDQSSEAWNWMFVL